MEMTIDEIIRSLTTMKSVVGVNQFTINKAVDICARYKKIEQIMKSKKMNALNIGLLIPKDMACILNEIKEVLEDGNDKI